MTTTKQLEKRIKELEAEVASLKARPVEKIIERTIERHYGYQHPTWVPYTPNPIPWWQNPTWKVPLVCGGITSSISAHDPSVPFSLTQ